MALLKGMGSRVSRRTLLVHVTNLLQYLQHSETSDLSSAPDEGRPFLEDTPVSSEPPPRHEDSIRCSCLGAKC